MCTFKSICVQFALLLSALLALGPFLHAHYGASTTTGLHVAGVNSVAVSIDSSPTVVSFSQDQEQESAAVGVETSFARKLAFDVEEQPQLVLALTIFVVAGVIQSIASVLPKLGTQRTRHPFFLAGFPPLPHAPPSLRF